MRNGSSKIVSVLALGFAIAFASVVVAHDRGKDKHRDDDRYEHHGFPGGNHHGFPRPGCSFLRPRLEPVCKQQCESEERACKAQAREALRSCLDSNCAQALAAARSACAASLWSQQCVQAWQAYLQCAQPCNAAYRTGQAECRAAEDACKAACPLAPMDCPLPPDPLCLMGCKAEESACKATAQQTAASCLQGCASQLATARQACAANPFSAECQSALQALRSCMMPCSLALRTSLEACKTAEKACKASCNNSSLHP